uniref:AH receptor-interacting protein n=1 Tax=Myxine glutinosa TaxID=7769 RepID=UPI00358E87FD
MRSREPYDEIDESCWAKGSLLDDSRAYGRPMELLLGKQFKLPVWETLLRSMRPGEVAIFCCDPPHVALYPTVARSLRKIVAGGEPEEMRSHCCGLAHASPPAHDQQDLADLQAQPQPLLFTMELIKVEEPGDYEQELWAMNDEELLAAVPRLHTEGNAAYHSGDMKRAAKAYHNAIVCLKNLQMKEKPGDAPWLELDTQINPVLLNLCQCNLNTGDFYSVIEHTSSIISKYEDNVKAYFKRGRAHAAVWNEKEARSDFTHAADLDPSLKPAIQRELAVLSRRLLSQERVDKERYKHIFK